MDIEQQIRLNFLDEAVEYFDGMESNLLGLANTQIDVQQLDLILRYAHSVKGGAAMMGFKILSRVAHHLEDFLKILRVRHDSTCMTMEVETLLLQGVDCLRYISSLYRQGEEIDDADIIDRTQPIFEQLRKHLGELEVQDENALLAAQESCNPALLIFEEGVNTVLASFANQLKVLGNKELAEELVSAAQELVRFGKMANLEPFIQLCQSVQQQATILSPLEIKPFAEEVLKVWQRSHALVVRGSIERLPSSLEIDPANSDPIIETDFNSIEDNALISGLQSAFELDTAKSDLTVETDFNSIEDNALISGLQSAFELDIAAENISNIQPSQNDTSSSSQQSPSIDKMVRVPDRQLKQFNHLFEQLIVDRSNINLRLQQCQNVLSLMSKRMSQMEHSNTQLKQWYNIASVEEVSTNPEQPLPNSVSPPSSKDRGTSDLFDSLEMDRYDKLHIICQEQIETLVQLQEVTKDIDLGLQELNQAVHNLNYTTKSMQGNVIRTQMLPFGEVVKRFPRLLRELNLQFNKQVNLKVTGEYTLIDRAVIEALSDPLMHLLRNAFDHGIEDLKTRIANGKSPSGTIEIEASNQGTYTIITLRDDGGGISHSKIRDRLYQMGMAQAEVAKMSEAELLNFIFEPGFSTTEQVTELSGRGVGMDVVRTNLQAIRGDIRVATKPGKGTTFTLRIPFTLSILRVAVIEQAGILFAIPANSIREMIPLTSKKSKLINWHGSNIPLVKIEKTLAYNRSHNINFAGNPAINETMAIVVGNEKLVAALQIDYFWHEQESTIRPIDSPIPLPPGIISSMIFGDGRVIPLVDPLLLIEECLKNPSTSDRSNQKIAETKHTSTIKTILITDDSINIRRYLSLTLEKAGYQVEQAKDGREAVDKLLGGLAVQAVICDLEMPRLDGYGVLEVIKGRAQFTHLPIVMLTSRNNEKHRQLAMNLGASAYLSKPYNEQELLNKLAELLQSHAVNAD